jgi:glycosyltransferase involved in cell wall biosynthesis
MPEASLVISVYDKCRELELIFHALNIQKYPLGRLEIIVAEDGENESIRETVMRWKANSKLNLKHITQEDRGFRKNKILNKAIISSESSYLIFIDGDCIPHPEFVQAHITSIERNTVLCGRRVNLTKNATAALTPGKINSGSYSSVSAGDVIFSVLNRTKPGFDYNAEEGFIIKSELMRNLLMNKDEHILGCNFSVHKSMMESINGFDENYEGPGLGEDSDIEFRLRSKGAKFKSVRNLAVVYHLYHPKTVENSSNMEYFLKVKADGAAFCKNGLIKS